ncbi:MAG: RNA polymerase subunit sigma-24, partial [Roseateles sp.]
MNPAELAAGVWRSERSRLIGAAARLLRDLDEAEDCAQDALLSALDTWPRDGLPTHPAAWLM